MLRCIISVATNAAGAEKERAQGHEFSLWTPSLHLPDEIVTQNGVIDQIQNMAISIELYILNAIFF
jgi:hypothetical protein